MNSNATCHRTGITPSECQIYTFMGGKPDQTVTTAYAVHVLITVLSSIACPLTTVLNLLVIISVKRKAQLKTISNTVLGCLAVTDALMGMIGLPVFVISRILSYQAETSSDFCAVKDVSRHVLRILARATLFHLTLMNVERYIAIKHPFQHITIVTKSRVLVRLPLLGSQHFSSPSYWSSRTTKLTRLSLMLFCYFLWPSLSTVKL